MTVTTPLDEEVDELLGVLLARGQDFRHYARAALVRRLGRALDELACTDVGELVRRLHRGDELLPTVVDHLTVNVTSFFRDPPFWRALRTDVVPMLATWPSLKAWVAGCSTGEEAWSLAVLLDEEGLLDRTLVYATDLSEGAIAQAATGTVAVDALAEASRCHRESGGRSSLTERFRVEGDRARVEDRLRRRVVFAEHSLATDGVFSEVHLVTCRNVLIYFDRSLQDRAVALFQDALVPGGFLGLGSRESLRGNAVADAFEPVVAPQRIYRRR